MEEIHSNTFSFDIKRNELLYLVNILFLSVFFGSDRFGSVHFDVCLYFAIWMCVCVCVCVCVRRRVTLVVVA